MKKVLYTIALLFFTAMNVYSQANAGPDDLTCGNIYTLQADTAGIDTAQGTWSCEMPGVNFDNVNDLNATVTIPEQSFGDSSYVEILFIWTVNTDSDTVLITFYEQPAAFAGNDTNVCGACFDLQAEFSIANANGVWFILSGPGSVTFGDMNNPNTFVCVSQYGTYYFIWEEKNAVNPLCSSKDTVVIEFIEVPDIYIEAYDYVCGLCVDLDVIGSFGTGQWIPCPGISYADDTNPNTQACAAGYGSYALVWVEYAGPCVVMDTIIVTFIQQPNAWTFMDTIGIYSVCGTDFDTLQAPDPGIPGANSYWWDEIPGTTFHPVPDTNNVTAIIDPAQYGLHTFHWIVNNSGCMDISAGINIYFIEQPTPDAGPRYDTANGNTYALNGLQTIDTSVVTWWSLDTANIVFASTNWDTIGNTIYDTVLCNITLPHIADIYLTEANGMCVSRDTITITFLPFNYINEYKNPDFLQIYPNPYNDFINIKYYLKKKTTVNIKIFDVSGKEVQTIVSSIQAKGEYAYTFNAKQIGLQSGTYFVKLKFNNTTYLKKILEVK